MNKHTMNEPLSIDDVHYTKSIILDYVQGYLTFDQLLEVIPADVNLAKLMVMLKELRNDELTKKVSELIINHYYNRLKEVKNFTEEKYLKKLLTAKEVFFITDADVVEKIVEGTPVDLAEEFRVAFNPVREKIQSLMAQKVLGSSKTKIALMIKPYDSIFVRDKFLKSTPGIMSASGEITYVDNNMIDKAEQFLTDYELYPARMPTEKYLFELCRREANKNVEIEK